MMIYPKFIYFLVVFLCFGFTFNTQAQTARKPSYYENQTRTIKSKTSTPTQSITIKKPALLSLDSINDQATFDQLARTYELGTLYEIPHVLFLVDLQDKNRVYYLNTPHYKLHENFIQNTLLKKKLSRDQLNTYYTSPTRRFLLGTLSWQNILQAYTYEYWEGDPLSKNFLALSQKLINQSFFAPVTFKTNSLQQEQLAKQNNVKYVTQAALIKEQSYLALNTGTATGQIHIIESEQDLETVKPTDIIILKETPISLPPVAAIITEQPSTVLSHVNLLAKSWKIPNAYIKEAATVFKDHNKQWVNLNVMPSQYAITPTQEIKNTTVSQPPIIKSATNTSIVKLFPLKRLSVKDIIYCGSKAANLGEITNKLPHANVPDGFCIPFGQYQQFMQQHKLFDELAKLEADPEFQISTKARQQALATLREKIINTPVDKATIEAWRTQWQQQLRTKPVFVRSSSNSEDLPNFNGAGLYSSVPNVTTAKDLEQAVKTVWASTFNYEAYETRRLMKLPADFIKMSVLIQESIDSDKSGVMITRDPFDTSRPYITYIAAKRGIGIKVVEGKAIAEQVMYSSWSKAIQILTLSQEQSALQAASEGGVVEQAITTSDIRILDEQLIIKLAKLGNQIKYLLTYKEKNKMVFKDQDIEWAEKDGKLFILQARPYIH